MKFSFFIRKIEDFTIFAKLSVNLYGALLWRRMFSWHFSLLFHQSVCPSLRTPITFQNLEFELQKERKIEQSRKCHLLLLHFPFSLWPSLTLHTSPLEKYHLVPALTSIFTSFFSNCTTFYSITQFDLLLKVSSFFLRKSSSFGVSSLWSVQRFFLLSLKPLNLFVFQVDLFLKRHYFYEDHPIFIVFPRWSIRFSCHQSI